MKIPRLIGSLSLALAGLQFPACANSAGVAASPASQTQAAVASDMRAGISALLASLEGPQRAKACYAFDSAERKNWHFIPKSRNGLPIKEMNEKQRLMARALLKTALSERGVSQVQNIMDVLEAHLRENEPAERKEMRQPLGYFVTVFGEPSATAPWGWRFEGHHFSMTFTLVGDQVTAVPHFFGTNPGTVPSGPNAGLSVLGQEEKEGRALLLALTPEHRTKAVFEAKAPADILLVPNREAAELKPLGISFGELSPSEQALFRKLVELHAHRLRNDLANRDLARIAEKGWEKVFFGWAGSDQPGQGHYYRLQGPTFIIEYDNTQNNANHVHVIWRDRENEFGADFLRAHYEQTPHGAGSVTK